MICDVKFLTDHEALLHLLDNPVHKWGQIRIDDEILEIKLFYFCNFCYVKIMACMYDLCIRVYQLITPGLLLSFCHYISGGRSGYLYTVVDVRVPQYYTHTSVLYSWDNIILYSLVSTPSPSFSLLKQQQATSELTWLDHNIKSHTQDWVDLVVN